MIRPVRLNPQSLENPSGVAIAGVLVVLAAAGGAGWYFYSKNKDETTGASWSDPEKRAKDTKLIEEQQKTPKIYYADGRVEETTREKALEMVASGEFRWSDAVQRSLTNKPLEKHKFAKGEGKNVRGMAISGGKKS